MVNTAIMEQCNPPDDTTAVKNVECTIDRSSSDDQHTLKTTPRKREQKKQELTGEAADAKAIRKSPRKCKPSCRKSACFLFYGAKKGSSQRIQKSLAFANGKLNSPDFPNPTSDKLPKSVPDSDIGSTQILDGSAKSADVLANGMNTATCSSNSRVNIDIGKRIGLKTPVDERVFDADLCDSESDEGRSTGQKTNLNKSVFEKDLCDDEEEVESNRLFNHCGSPHGVIMDSKEQIRADTLQNECSGESNGMKSHCNKESVTEVKLSKMNTKSTLTKERQSKAEGGSMRSENPGREVKCSDNSHKHGVEESHTPNTSLRRSGRNSVRKTEEQKTCDAVTSKRNESPSCKPLRGKTNLQEKVERNPVNQVCTSTENRRVLPPRGKRTSSNVESTVELSNKKAKTQTGKSSSITQRSSGFKGTNMGKEQCSKANSQSYDADNDHQSGRLKVAGVAGRGKQEKQSRVRRKSTGSDNGKEKELPSSRGKRTRSASCSGVRKSATNSQERQKPVQANKPVAGSRSSARKRKQTNTETGKNDSAVSKNVKKCRSKSTARGKPSDRVPDFPSFDDSIDNFAKIALSTDLSKDHSMDDLNGGNGESCGNSRKEDIPFYLERDLNDVGGEEDDKELYSPSVMSDDDDDDDDLPDVFNTPTSQKGCVFKPEEIVWARIRKAPAWPAIVKSIHKKKHKASVYFIGYPQTRKRGFGVNIRNLKPYNCSERDHFIDSVDTEKFKGCVQQVDDYLRKRGLGTVNVSSPLEFFQEEDSQSFQVDDDAFFDLPEESEDDNEPEMKEESVNTRDGPKKDNVKTPIAKRKKVYAEKRGTACQRKMQKFLDFIMKNDKAKDQLIAIANGTQYSERHHIYMNGPNSKKMQLKFTGFGPIVDENQQEDLYHYLLELYGKHILEKTGGFSGISYVTEVWIPEAILIAIENVRKVSRKEAVKIFYEEGDYQQSHNRLQLFDFPQQTEQQEEVLDPVNRYANDSID
ncbi:PWWP domain-containing DNA repair factor 3A-like [Ptychodera flava]|uniref:PWWP domain-containing DNA repair factor 3A-like n=1 Tax=Ptychodera flava TaxID=63121 RepID=UPI00396A0548